MNLEIDILNKYELQNNRINELKYALMLLHFGFVFNCFVFELKCIGFGCALEKTLNRTSGYHEPLYQTSLGNLTQH